MTLEECNQCSKRGDLKTCSRWHLLATWTETIILISQFPQPICCPSVWPVLHQGTFRCGMAAFCGPECQKKGWTEHRVDCRLHMSVLGHDNCKCQFNHRKTRFYGKRIFQMIMVTDLILSKAMFYSYRQINAKFISKPDYVLILIILRTRHVRLSILENKGQGLVLTR